MFEEDFVASFFDQLYDADRADVNTTTSTVITKESTLGGYEKSQGWYGKLSSDLFNFLTLTAAYQDMYGDNDIHYRSIWGNAAFNTSIIPKLSTAEIGYYQSGFDKLDKLKAPSAMIDGKLAYTLGGGAQLVGMYQVRYVDLDDNGKIKGKDETIKTVTMGVEFQF
jgi:hypothetical protein